MSRSFAEQPQFERSDLFESGVGGYAAYRIPGLVVTSSGSVLVYCEARRDSRSDWAHIDILMRRSTDGGRTWDAPRQMADVPGPKSKNPAVLAHGRVNPDHVTYNNPVAIADRTGTVHFLFCLEYARCFYLRSEDDGVTWSSPVEITDCFEQFRPHYDWKVLATGPGHGIQLSSGRLVVPVWLSTASGGNAHRPSVTSVIYSDDQGSTWHAGEVAVPHTDAWVNPSEAALAELSDGRVLLNARTESKSHRRVVTQSDDGATGWTTPRFAESLVEPICMGSLATHRGKDAHWLLFANPDNLARRDGRENPGTSRDRINLTIRLSEDDGATWKASRALEPQSSAYSDLAVLPDGTILCFYERGARPGEDAQPRDYAFLTLARFHRDWLLQGAAEGTHE